MMLVIDYLKNNRPYDVPYSEFTNYFRDDINNYMKPTFARRFCSLAVILMLMVVVSFKNY